MMNYYNIPTYVWENVEVCKCETPICSHGYRISRPAVVVFSPEGDCLRVYSIKSFVKEFRRNPMTFDRCPIEIHAMI